MKPEIEAKFLDVDHDDLRAKLQALGATCKQPMQLMRRKNFDFPDNRLDDERNAWVRVRDEGNKITMTYKQLDSREIDGTQEVNLTVDDFDSACSFLETIGLVCKTVQETRRESWLLDGCEVELDEWPWIRPFVEIEGADEAALRLVADKLGLDWAKVCHGSVEIAYQSDFDVTGKDIDHIPVITFEAPLPEMLASKRR